MSSRNVVLGLLVFTLLPSVVAPSSRFAVAEQVAGQAVRMAGDEARLSAVVDFADNALDKGRDRWSGDDAPLFVDGLEVETGEPVEWVRSGRRYVISNLASQQNFFRTLVALSNLTGDERYRQAAKEATAHMFEHFRSPCGLLYWGGHTFVDLRTLEVVHIEGPHMEIKMHLPYYDLMWDVDPQATAGFIRAYWNSNLWDWGRLEINRHAPYGKKPGAVWDSDWDDPQPLYETRGHGSVMPITDMTYSAAWLSQRTDENSLVWARRMADLMTRSRHPETGLGSGRFSVLEARREYTGVTEPRSTAVRETYTDYGDRARNRFGPEFGEGALDAWNLTGVAIARRIYVEYALSQMAIAEELGDGGDDFLAWTVDGLIAYAKHGYDPEKNVFRAMLGDGSDLTGYVIKRGLSAGQTLEAIPADAAFLLSYARAWRLSGEEELWATVRDIARGNGLGDLGQAAGRDPSPDLKTGCDDPLALLAVLEVYRGNGDDVYLALARRIGDNIVQRRYRNQLFVESERNLYARFDALEPLALLALEAAVRGESERVPAFVGGLWRYLQGPYDGHGRARDYNLFYARDAHFQEPP